MRRDVRLAWAELNHLLLGAYEHWRSPPRTAPQSDAQELTATLRRISLLCPGDRFAGEGRDWKRGAGGRGGGGGLEPKGVWTENGPNQFSFGQCFTQHKTEGCTYMCAYAYTCPCARANAVRGPFCYCLFAPTTCRQCLQLAGRVYLWCTASTDYTQVNVYVNGVYKLCTGSTDCTHMRRRRVHVYAHTRIYVHI